MALWEISFLVSSLDKLSKNEFFSSFMPTLQDFSFRVLTSFKPCLFRKSANCLGLKHAISLVFPCAVRANVSFAVILESVRFKAGET